MTDLAGFLDQRNLQPARQTYIIQLLMDPIEYRLIAVTQQYCAEAGNEVHALLTIGRDQNFISTLSDLKFVQHYPIHQHIAGGMTMNLPVINMHITVATTATPCAQPMTAGDDYLV